MFYIEYTWETAFIVQLSVEVIKLDLFMEKILPGFCDFLRGGTNRSFGNSILIQSI